MSPQTDQDRELAPRRGRPYKPRVPRILLCALALAAACAKTDAPPAARPIPAVPTPEPPASECPTSALPAVPFERAGDRRQQLDALTFWGWSADGRRFAYETFDAGPGAATCEGAIRLLVLDADTGSLAPDGLREIRPTHPDSEPCDPPDLDAAMAAERTAVLGRHGISLGNLLAPVEPLPAPAPRPGVKAYAILLPSGQTATATLEVLHGERDQAFQGEGAAFKLELAVPDRPPLVLESGQSRYPYLWNFDLDRGLVFVDPAGTHLALLLATTQISFEGDRTSYIARAFEIPPGW